MSSSSPRRRQARPEHYDPHSSEASTNNSGKQSGSSVNVNVGAPNGRDKFRHPSAGGLASNFGAAQHQTDQQRQHWGTATASASAYSNAFCNQGFNIAMCPTMGVAYHLLNSNPVDAPVVHSNSVPYIMAAASGRPTMPSTHQFVHYGYSPYSLYQMQPFSALDASQISTQHLPSHLPPTRYDVTFAERESLPDDEDAFRMLFMEKFQQKLSDRFVSDEAAASQPTEGSSQQSSLLWGQVMDDYLDQKRALVENTRQLLGAQIAHERSLLQRQYDLVRQNETMHESNNTEEIHSDQTGGLKQIKTTETSTSSQKSTQDCLHKQTDARALGKTGKASPAQAHFSLLKKCSAGQTTTSASEESKSRDTKPSLSIVKNAADLVPTNSVGSKKIHQTSPKSNTKKRKRGPPKKHNNSTVITRPSSIPLESLTSSFPKNYEAFIQDIALDNRAENIIDKFNERFDPVKESILWSAVKEDTGHIQEEREARQLFYEEQIETMNKRLQMYSRLEEAVELISVENSRNPQPKHARSLFKTHIREVTMDLVHIGLSNYQLLEDNMDNILNINT